MKTIVKSQVPGQIHLAEKEMPVLSEGEVLIEVAYCGVCGSDIHAVKQSKGYEHVKQSTILGHELSGKVVKVHGEDNKKLLNKNVIVESMHYCGECENCKLNRHSICSTVKVMGLHLNGGMAQYAKVKALYVQEIEEELPIDIASLIEPMAIAIHAVKKLQGLEKKKKVLVQGPGIIGFFTSIVCAHKEADVILSGLESDYTHRLSRASDFGIKPHIADKEELDLKVDYIFECSGSSAALKSGYQYLKKGGDVVVVALYEQETTLFLTDLVRNEWPLIASYGCDPEDYNDASKILIHYKDILRDVISFFPLEEAEKAFEKSMTQQVLKAVLYNSM